MFSCESANAGVAWVDPLMDGVFFLEQKIHGIGIIFFLHEWLFFLNNVLFYNNGMYLHFYIAKDTILQDSMGD